MSDRQPSRRWPAPSARLLVVPLAAAAGVLLYREHRRGSLGTLVRNLRTYSMPSSGSYAALFNSLVGGFYRRVAQECATVAPKGDVLDVGSGPGRPAVDLARLASGVRVTGNDVVPEMVKRANALAAREGVADRTRFQLGDATALPFPDESFDLVASTLSLHHWPDPARGLAEIYRVLRPGGAARIYDAARWLSSLEYHGPDLPALVSASPFGGGSVSTSWWVGPVPVVLLASLARPNRPEGA